MKLEEVEIQNFRSIKHQILELKHNCMILVGKNEAGKSNLLKAIGMGLADLPRKIEPRDFRKKNAGEKIPDTDYVIKYKFSLNEEELNEFSEHIESVLPDNIFTLNKKNITNKEIIYKFFTSSRIWVEFKKSSTSAHYYSTPEDLQLSKQLFKLLRDTEIDGKLYKSGTIVTGDKIKTWSEESCLVLKRDDVLKVFSEYLTTYANDNIPEIIYWKYEEKFLLPTSVSLQNFVSDPSCCQPLKNLFQLAGYDDLKKAFSDAKAEDGDYFNLLANVSTVATKEFKKKWPDLKEISFNLDTTQTDILPKVTEGIKFNYQDRSDGFKQFLAILLMISTQVDSGRLENTIILIDEPDQSLYPTGCKYLMGELLKISSNNTVLYSTHSPFMIDKSCMDRHLIIEKNKGETKIKPADIDSQYTNDEVLLNAIGTSTFENIKNTNILFEGWTDYEIFRKVILSKNKEFPKLAKCGTSFAHGAPSIKNITPLLQFLNKKVLIFTDSDKASKDAQKSFIDSKGYCFEYWKTFYDLNKKYDNYSIEDFIKKDLIARAFQEYSLTYDLSQKTEDTPLWLFVKDIDKEQKNQIKYFIAQHAKITDVKDEYISILKEVENTLKDFE